MARWEPGTRERLQAAALELFVSQGFDETTASGIAAAAGVTERTFFRHFTDKREVLFEGQHVLAERFTAGVDDAPEDASPADLVSAALRGAGEFFPDDRRAWSRRRQAVIDAHPALQERELLKLAGLARDVAAAFADRGVPEPAASLAGQSCLTVFGVAFGLWIAEGETRPFAELASLVHGELARVASAPGR